MVRPRKENYFVATRGDFEITPSRWSLKYEQPDGWYLVQTVNEFMTYCAQLRPGEDPDAVLLELVDSGAIQEAPAPLLKQLEDGGVIRREQGRFTRVT